MNGLFRALYLASIALLPWSWFPPFPWLHEHAQWSDALFAAAALLWALDRARGAGWPRVRPVHVAMASYLVWQCVSHAAAGFEPAAGTFKLLGVAGLVMLAIVTEDFVSRSGGVAPLARTLAATSVLLGAAAIAAVVLYSVGVTTPLLADLGDLAGAGYPRVRAGLPLPNLLASFAVVALGMVLHRDAGLSRWQRLVAMAALWSAAALSLSRGLIAMGLALLVAHGETHGRRRAAAALGLAAAMAMMALTYWNVALDPTRPARVRLRGEPSSRRAAVSSSAETLARRPFVGVGPGNLPGMRGGAPCDAHLTPLNVAATAGLPALAAFVAIPWALWRGRGRPADLAIWGALAGVGLDALSQDVEDFRHVWLAFGVAARRSVDNPRDPASLVSQTAAQPGA